MSTPRYQQAPSEKDRKAFAKYLSSDEELVIATGYGKIYIRSQFLVSLFWPGGIFIAIGLGAAYLLGVATTSGLILGFVVAIIVAILKTVLEYHAHRYILTTRRVIVKKGVFAVAIASALYDKISHIEVDQSFFNRIFTKHGNIIVSTAGSNKGELVLQYVDYPIEFKNILERLINREREQYGIKTGPIVTVEGELV